MTYIGLVQDPNTYCRVAELSNYRGLSINITWPVDSLGHKLSKRRSHTLHIGYWRVTNAGIRSMRQYTKNKLKAFELTMVDRQEINLTHG